MQFSFWILVEKCFTLPVLQVFVCLCSVSDILEKEEPVDLTLYPQSNLNVMDITTRSLSTLPLDKSKQNLYSTSPYFPRGLATHITCTVHVEYSNNETKHLWMQYPASYA